MDEERNLCANNVLDRWATDPKAGRPLSLEKAAKLRDYVQIICRKRSQTAPNYMQPSICEARLLPFDQTGTELVVVPKALANFGNEIGSLSIVRESRRCRVRRPRWR